MDSVGGNIFTKVSDIKSGLYNAFGGGQNLEQNVRIDASFPSVNSKREIE